MDGIVGDASDDDPAPRPAIARRTARPLVTSGPLKRYHLCCGKDGLHEDWFDYTGSFGIPSGQVVLDKTNEIIKHAK